MKAKEYFKTVGRVLLYAPFVLAGVVVICAGVLVKSAGYCLLGEFDRANEEIKSL